MTKFSPGREIRKTTRRLHDAFSHIGRHRAGEGTHVGKFELKDGVTIVRLKGAITYDTLSAIHDDHDATFKGKKIKSILADFANVTEIDTAVVVALVDRLKAMRSAKTGGSIGLINLPSKMRSLLEISKTHELFTEYLSEEEAVSALK